MMRTMRPRNWSVLCAMITAQMLTIPSAASAPPEVNVSVDPRVELICIILNLADYQEYARPAIPPYAADVARHFGPFRDHAAVKLARDLRRSRSIGFDAPMSLAVHLKDGSSFELAVPLEPWPNIDARWRAEDVERFLREVRRFAADSDFDAFFDAHREQYELAERRMHETIRQHANLAWFDEFFGVRPGAEFNLIVGMLNGHSNYGLRATVNGVERLYCILGVWQSDSDGQPVFGPDVIPTVVHEFCHSYVNPLVDRYGDELKDAGQRLYAARRAIMQRQAYASPQTVLRESLVRACVVRYMYVNDGLAAGTTDLLHQHARGFTWTGELSAALAKYELNRKDYPTLEAFMPRIVTCLQDASEKVSKE